MNRQKLDRFSCALIRRRIFIPAARAPAMRCLALVERVLGREWQPFNHFLLLFGELRPFLEPALLAARALSLPGHAKKFLPNKLRYLLATCSRVT
jgi:hypothetical protein